ncbi:MAG: ATP-binding protein [Oscillospiraceae bacterium]|nr:ATP-binding protein [Oscillospiraceae bacterium]
MVKIIMGLKGSGKTKELVGLVCKAVSEGSGDVVVIEKERKLTYDIPYQARLIDAGSYSIGSYEFLKGFISGIHAGNYDITHFFIDNFYKLVNDRDEASVIDFVRWLAAYAERENIEFVVSMSSDRDKCPEEIKPYLI